MPKRASRRARREAGRSPQVILKLTPRDDDEPAAH
jgi:hypothetical protein